MPKKRYQLVGLGGTFDHFHAGHASFIKFASSLGAQLLIGVTDIELTRYKMRSNLIQPYFKRARAVHHFCQKNQIRHKIVKLSDPFGPAIDGQSNIDALAVTTNTVSGGEKINEIRRRLKLPQLPIYTHKMLHDQSGEVLSSLRIRSGVVNREGQVYGSVFSKDFKLSETQRKFFQKLHGQIVSEPAEITKTTVVVGDISLEKFQQAGWFFNLGIFDNFSERTPVETATKNSPLPIQTIDNPAGTISSKAFQFISDFLQNYSNKKPHLLKIKGEEDLMTVVAVLASPLDTIVYYGQPNQGLVELKVTEELKNNFYSTLAS